MAIVKNWSGSWGLPDLGITEGIQSIFAPRSQQTAQGGSNLSGLWSGQAYAPMQSSGQVMGASTTAQNYSPTNAGIYAGYGGDPRQQQQRQPAPQGGGQPSGGGGGAPMESTPGQPDFSAYDAAIAEAQNALNAGEQAAQSGYDAAVNDATTSGAARTTQAKQAQTEKLGALNQNITDETGRSENAISQARRQAAELMQGLQARFGKSTGTGAFAGELMGRATMQNIGAIQTGLQGAITKIHEQEQNVRNTTATLLDQITKDVDNAKLQARAAFDQARAEIASKKGELQSRKAELMMNALQNYQQLLSGIEARNTAFKQQLYLKAQSTQQQLDTFKNQVQEKIMAQWEQGQLPSWSNAQGQSVTYVPQLRGYTTMQYTPKKEEDIWGGDNQTASAEDALVGQ